jgi:hypothetical protein
MLLIAESSFSAFKLYLELEQTVLIVGAIWHGGEKENFTLFQVT